MRLEKPTSRQRSLSLAPMVDGRQHAAPCAFRNAAAQFPTGVTLVTAGVGDATRGMTANSFTSISLDPLLLLVSIRRNSQMNRLVAGSGGFGVSVLALQQIDIARRFATPGRPAGRRQFADVDWWPAPTSGSPLITGALAWFDCVVDRSLRTGDHTVFLGRVTEFDYIADGTPLVFFDGAYRGIDFTYAESSRCLRPTNSQVSLTPLISSAHAQ